MKLLTLNTHSLEEENMEEKQKKFAETVAKLQPDVIALQEVNQSIAAAPVMELPAELTMVQTEVPLKEDNHALAVFRLLKENGMDYNFAWLPVKVGYDKYDEGLAIFTKKPIIQTDSLLLSAEDNYEDWRTRKALQLFTEDGRFVCVHMGWWKDAKEPFKWQWKKLQEYLGHGGQIYLMGDFNADSAVCGEGYDLILSDGWNDLYEETDVNKEGGFTVNKVIDGWKEGDTPGSMRIDYIFSNLPVHCKHMRTCFNGEDEEVISDHFGLFAEVDDPKSE